MMENVANTNRHGRIESDAEIAPGVWLRGAEPTLARVEIVLPPRELAHVCATCDREFTEFATRVCPATHAEESARVTCSDLSPEVVRGIWNMQILNAIMTQRMPRDTNISLRLVQAAYYLVYRGRLQLTFVSSRWVA